MNRLKQLIYAIPLIIVNLAGAQPEPNMVGGTASGKLIYYGHHFETLHEVETGLELTDVAIGPSGEVFLVSQGRIYRYDQDSAIKTLFYENNEDYGDEYVQPYVEDISINYQGEILILVRGIYGSDVAGYRVLKSQLSSFSETHNSIFSFGRDEDGFPIEINSLTIDDSGNNVWFSVNQPHLFGNTFGIIPLEELSDSNPDLVKYFNTNPFSKSIFVAEISVDDKGTLYALAQNNIYAIDADARKILPITSLADEPLFSIAHFPKASANVIYQPSILSYSNLMIGRSLTRYLKIENYSNAVLDITTSINNDFFQVTGLGPISPGEKAQFSISYSPKQKEDFKDYLLINNGLTTDSIPIIANSTEFSTIKPETALVAADSKIFELDFSNTEPTVIKEFRSKGFQRLTVDESGHVYQLQNGTVQLLDLYNNMHQQYIINEPLIQDIIWKNGKIIAFFKKGFRYEPRYFVSEYDLQLDDFTVEKEIPVINNIDPSSEYYHFLLDHSTRRLWAFEEQGQVLIKYDGAFSSIVESVVIQDRFVKSPFFSANGKLYAFSKWESPVKLVSIDKSTGKVAEIMETPFLSDGEKAATFYGVVSQNPVTSESDTYIFPNPFKTLVSIDSRDNLINKVVIYDLNGRAFDVFNFTHTENETLELDLSHLKRGIYFIDIFTIDGNRFSERILKR